MVEAMGGARLTLVPTPLDGVVARARPWLRALADGMRIEAVRVDTLPIGVDTPADLARARELLAPRAS